MRYFEFSDRLTADTCALAARNRDNASIQDYLLQRRSILPDRIMDRAFELLHEHPNLRIHDGLDPQMIDVDSSIRHSIQTNPREKEQLGMRTFHAVPNLARGVHKPDLESELINAESGTVLKQCSYKLAEVDYQRFVPLVDLVRESQTCSRRVPDSYSIGIDSREMVRAQMRSAK